MNVINITRSKYLLCIMMLNHITVKGAAKMKYTLFLLPLLLLSCTSVSVGKGRQKVIIQSPKDYCDVKKANKPCKVYKESDRKNISD